jgi:4-amino-4-deoxy-L-arabinose transferase-like glycosyltransferase
MTDVVDEVIELEPLEPVPQSGPSAPVRPSTFRRFWRGPEHDPAWARPALFALLAATGVLYLWNLSASGWANSYYSMAVQAGSKSWKAMFFGSLDAGNSITVDKTPASLWAMDLSARMFGVNSWSTLAPQALEGVATVAVLYMAVKRWFGAVAGLIAGGIVAITPVAAVMFRFNNPDALLVLLFVVGAYAVTRALEKGSTWWLAGGFAAVGFAFLTKELQALLVLPAFGLAYLVAGPPKFGRRIVQLLIATTAFIVSAGWWVAIVMLTPASARPYIGGSQNNSFWNVLFGYNGLGRLNGNENGSVVGGGGQGRAGAWGPTGLTRMFNAQFGGEASWFLPAALILLVAGLAFTWRMRRTDHTRAALILWGGWLLVTAAAFSLGQGIIHPYYTVALAPPIGAVVGIGVTRVWNGRAHPAAMAVLVAALAATAWWSYKLLGRTPNWHPALRTFVLVGGVLGTIALLVSALPPVRKFAGVIAAGALIVAVSGSTAYTLATAGNAYHSAIPTAGPSSRQSGAFGPRNFRGGAFPGFNGGQNPFGNGQSPFANGQAPFRGNAQPPFGGDGQSPFGTGQSPFGGGRGGAGGLLEGSDASPEMVALLKQNAHGYTWVAATSGANNAAGYQLASGKPVMAIGGFNGTDPSPTLAQFQSYVAQHKIHYYISGGGGFGGGGFRGGGGGSSDTSQISQWVQSNFTSTNVGGVTVYDLTAPTAG